jgi:hypothetical protein
VFSYLLHISSWNISTYETKWLISAGSEKKNIIPRSYQIFHTIFLDHLVLWRFHFHEPSLFIPVVETGKMIYDRRDIRWTAFFRETSDNLYKLKENTKWLVLWYPNKQWGLTYVFKVFWFFMYFITW